MCWFVWLNPYIIMGTGERSAGFVFPTHRLWQNPVEHPRLDSVSLMTLMTWEKILAAANPVNFALSMRWFCKEVALNMKDTFCGKQNCYMGLGTRCDDFFWRCCKHGSFRLLQFSRDDVPSNWSSKWMNMEHVYPFTCTSMGKWIFTQFVRHIMFTVYI